MGKPDREREGKLENDKPMTRRSRFLAAAAKLFADVLALSRAVFIPEIKGRSKDKLAYSEPTISPAKPEWDLATVKETSSK